MTDAPACPDTAAAAVAPRALTPWTAGLLYLVLTIAATWPLAARAASATFNVGGDTDLVSWILGWDAHAFLHQPFSIFDANIYYPERHTLAFAENLIGSALISSPVIWLTGNIVLSLNVVIILTCALCGFGGYVLGRRLGMTSGAAFITGAIFAFAPPRFGRLAQPHLNAVHWLPLLLASVHGYLDTGRRRDLWLGMAFFSLQVLSSGHGAVYTLISVALLLAYRAALGEPIAPLRRLRDFGLVGSLLMLPTVLVVLVYRSVQRDAGLERVLTRDWAPPAVNFLASNTHFHKYLISLVPGLHINERATGILFMGFLPMLLGLAALWPWYRPRRSGASARSGADRKSALRGGNAGGVPLAWRSLVLLLDLFALVALGVLIYRIANGPFKIRWERQVLFSVGPLWRPWLITIALLSLRARLWRRLPFDPLRWVRWGARVGMALAALAWRGLKRLPAAVLEWRAAHRRSAVLFYFLLGFVSLLLASPPPLGIWPHVYSLPGFNMVRVIARFTVITLLALSVLAGLGFDRLTARLGARARAILAVAALLVLGIEYTVAPLNPMPYSMSVPAIDRRLDTLPKPFVIAEFPVPAPRGTPSFESYQGQYMLHATAHWQKTIHGYSGHRTGLHEELYDLLASFPDEEGLRRLAELKVNYIVVHTDFYPPGEWAKAEGALAALGDRLRLLHTEGAGRVYAITSCQASARN